MKTLPPNQEDPSRLCAFREPDQNIKRSPDTKKLKWFLSSTNPARATVITAHGLNNKPRIMNSFITLLNSHGFHVLRVGFSGHMPEEDFGKLATRNNWLQDIHTAYCLAHERYPDLKLFNFSYSTGAAVTMDFLEQYPAARFEKMFFLAPAVSLTWKVSLIRLLTPLRIFGLSLPSFSPSKYRSHSWTPLRTYHNLIRVIDEVDSLQRRTSHASVPTVIVLSADDELVSLSGVRSWVQKNKLTAWQVKEIKREHKTGFNHLIVDKESLGEKVWDLLTRILITHFVEEDGPGATK